MNERERMARWANRRADGGGSSKPVPVESAVPAAKMPPAPDGYAYAWRPDVSAYILIPINPAPINQGHSYQPQGGHSHYSPQQPPPRPAPSRRIETCQIVRPGADPYADMMANVPELVPDNGGGYDSMKGNPSPESLEAMQLASQHSQEILSDVMSNIHGEIRYGAGRADKPSTPER